MVVVGLALRWWSIDTLRKAGVTLEEALRVRKPRSVANTGPYRYLTHPSYWGSLLVMAGFGVMAFGPAGALLALPAWPFYKSRMLAEEDLLWR